MRMVHLGPRFALVYRFSCSNSTANSTAQATISGQAKGQGTSPSMHARRSTTRSKQYHTLPVHVELDVSQVVVLVHKQRCLGYLFYLWRHRPTRDERHHHAWQPLRETSFELCAGKRGKYVVISSVPLVGYVRSHFVGNGSIKVRWHEYHEHRQVDSTWVYYLANEPGSYFYRNKLQREEGQISIFSIL